ncbi:MAG: hypothetical protein CMG69_04215 [Candidatus Marinimicrobia bacterium]|nr:hypothetical protein [Candidatus Neomarinimicrobiota bacterium]|tara:strand:+ start:39324 stop:40898 length:1575 start_codon:yes stop_codon:yes gene_type:complete
MSRLDVIVIGSGVNSLVTASLLAKAGKDVLVIEARDQIGGLASTQEFVTGFKCNMINDAVKWIDPRVMDNLNLNAYGLKLLQPDIVRIALGENKNHIIFHRDTKKTAASIEKQSENDAKVWSDFVNYINNISQFLEKLYTLTPPNLPKVDLKDALNMRSLLGPLWSYGTRGLVDLIRLAPMMMPELTDEWFENELLRAAVSTAGIHHLSFGPFAAGTGYNLLHQHLHSNGVFHQTQFVNGGSINLANSLKTSAESHGAVIRNGTPVQSINVKNGICSGITIGADEIIEAAQVVSGLDPKNTFHNLVGSSSLNPKFNTQLNNIRYRGSAARIHFALNDLPELPSIPEKHMGTVFSIAPSIEYLEKAADSVKYGLLPENPYIEFTVPSVVNPDFAPEGKHVLSATIQSAPYHLRDKNWDDGLKDQLKKNIINVLEEYIPGFSSKIEYTSLLTPVDIESQFGLTEGNLNHGEMTLDQFMFMRPTISAAQYKTPIKNLYICGPGTHPGGGLHGTSGFNAAREVLKNEF